MGLVTERFAEVWGCVDCGRGVNAKEGNLEGEDNNNGGADKRTAVLKMILFHSILTYFI